MFGSHNLYNYLLKAVVNDLVSSICDPMSPLIYSSRNLFRRTLKGLVMLSSLSPLCGVEPAQVFINQLEQEYDGTPKFPNISTDPPGLSLNISITPRRQSELVFSTIPLVPAPSYQSYGIDGTTNKALGDEVVLGGSNRFLESIEISMVNFSKAVDWPVLSGENPLGYIHPLTVIVYRVDGSNLTLAAQKTQEVLVPWKPGALDDGSEYPFGGIAFGSRFDFDGEVSLSGTIAVLVAYNTESSGFDPIGQAGPYNSMNVALREEAPLVGSDSDPTRMLRYLTGISRSRAFGALAPILKVRTFSATPAAGAAIDAGGYQVSATVSDGGFEGQSLANLEITPLEAAVVLSDLRQVADGTPKSVSVMTTPSGQPVDLVYARRSSLPVDPGLYPAFVSLKPGNYYGKASGTMRLGYSYDSWIAARVAGGSVPAEHDGRSDDADFDGVTNLEEYLAGTNPGDAADRRFSFLEITKVTGGFKLAFPRNNEAVDTNYRLEVSNDLGNESAWRDISLPAEGKMPFLPGELIEVTSPLVPGISSEFFRLRHIPQTP